MMCYIAYLSFGTDSNCAKLNGCIFCLFYAPVCMSGAEIQMSRKLFVIIMKALPLWLCLNYTAASIKNLIIS